MPDGGTPPESQLVPRRYMLTGNPLENTRPRVVPAA